MKLAANWTIATVFSLIALAFLSVGGMNLLARVFARSNNNRLAMKRNGQLALDVKF